MSAEHAFLLITAVVAVLILAAIAREARWAWRLTRALRDHEGTHHTDHSNEGDPNGNR